MNKLNKDIGQRISVLRKQQHMTQEQLAEQLDISVKHCSCVERGLSSLSLEKLIDLCEILDTNLDFLIRGETFDALPKLPPSFVTLLENAGEKEQQLLIEYLSLYSKIRNISE